LRWLVFLVYVIAWSAALLTPEPLRIWIAFKEVLHWQIPDDPEEDPGIQLEGYVISKTAHVGAYAVLAIIVAWLGVPWRQRLLLLTAMSLHAMGSEYCQGFVESRHPSWGDVGLDHLGILLGIGCAWKCWRSSGRPTHHMPPPITKLEGF
jgi:VanZ family protein